MALGFATVAIAVAGLITALHTSGQSSVAAGSSVTSLPAPPQPAAQITITPAPGQQVNPATPISVVVRDGHLRSVTVTDTATGASITGAMAPDGAGWRSTQSLDYAAHYAVQASAIGADQHLVTGSATLATLTPTARAAVSWTPSGAVSVGVGQPLVVRFSRPVTHKSATQAALIVTSSPAQPGSWYWMSSREAHYRPQNYWQQGTTITLSAKLLGVDLGGGTYSQPHQPAVIHVHDSWIARADGATKMMQIFDNGSVVKTMPISLGTGKTPTHSGPHVISDKQPSIIMDSCSYGVCKGQPGYYKEKVNLDERISNDGEFVHSAPWSVHQQGARNVSHGCVNLSPANAAWFYNHFSIGDVVEITHSSGPPLPIYDTYGDWELNWNQWQAGSIQP